MDDFFRSHCHCYLYLFFYCCISNAWFTGILYTRYFGSMSLLRSSDVEEDLGTTASRRRTTYVVILAHDLCCVIGARLMLCAPV